MMRTLKHGIFKYAIIGAILINGCSKQLDLKPTDSINENNGFRTVNDAQLGVNGAYEYYRALYSDIYLSALLSDEARLGDDNAGQGAMAYRYQFNAGTVDVQNGYAGYYTMIDQVNRVLIALPNVIVKAGEEPLRNELKGQLLALRAVAHFGLLQSFCKNYDPAGKGVPIMLVVDPSIRPGHNTMGEVMARIETDLEDAFTILSTSLNPVSDVVMNRVNVNAYRARIALYKGDYGKAISYANYVISTPQGQLAPAAAFGKTWTEVDFPTIQESLFRVRSELLKSPGYFWTTGSNASLIAPSDKLKSVYEPGDIRDSIYIGTVNGRRIVKKYKSGRPTVQDTRIVELKAIRSAEMYLIRAEAYAKQTSPNVAAGIADLNYLRSHRFVGAPAPLPTIVTPDQLVTAVLLERYRELCFEGSRFFDLKRNNLPVNRLSSDASAAWQNLPAGNDLFVMPIPFAEIQANPNAIQNPGY